MSGDSGFLDYRGYSGSSYGFPDTGYYDEYGNPRLPTFDEYLKSLRLDTYYDFYYSLSCTGMLIFYHTFPLILIYLIEFQNVTFRRLAKRCDLQPKGAPIASYIIVLTLVSGILAGLVSLRRYSIYVKFVIFAIFGSSAKALIVIGIIMLIKNNGLRWKTKSVYEEHSEHLLGEDKSYKKSSQEKSFSELLRSNWKVLIYEITQKCVFLIAFMAEPISTFLCAFVAYVLLAITAAVSGRSVAKEEVQAKVRVYALIAILLWVVVPFIAAFIVAYTVKV